jgi:hypothetical protein
MNASAWVDVAMEMAACSFPVPQLNAADLDDAIPAAWADSGGFRIQYDLPHDGLLSVEFLAVFLNIPLVRLKTEGRGAFVDKVIDVT